MLPDDLCPQSPKPLNLPTQPHSPAIYPTSVWECRDPEQAASLLAGELPGYVYQRDGHPNADQFAAKCAELHGAERAIITASGMAALSVAVLSQLQQGDHLIVSNRLYGRSLLLFGGECPRLGIPCSVVDTGDLSAVRRAMTERTRLIVVETLANPLLQVADIGGLAEIARQSGAQLLVDNTFASPALCRPLDLGADWVMESVSKMMNGHSDIMLGMLAGSAARWQRVPLVTAAWGLASSPFDCWLALRGLSTLAVRMERACANALQVAHYLSSQVEVARVDYPGLIDHPHHELAQRQLTRGFGSIVAFHLPGGTATAERFIRAARRIPFCPSLGEVATTLSHPESTSHRGLSAAERAELGITGGTIRLSVGIESLDYIVDSLAEGLAATTA
ncbi:MAG: trans-sulfuration enzyme family protein [Planctomycetota bacterium]